MDKVSFKIHLATNIGENKAMNRQINGDVLCFENVSLVYDFAVLIQTQKEERSGNTAVVATKTVSKTYA